jgi:hypothetical protein
MEEKKYNLTSPEVQKYLKITPEQIDPSIRQNYIRNLVDRLGLADIPGNYENEFAKQGIQPEALKQLQNYIGFDNDWKSQYSIETINQLTELAQSNPSPVYSYSTKESPLYRGAKIDPSSIPSIGETFSFDRFKSFTPDVLTAVPFTKGYKPFDLNDPSSFRNTDPEKIKTLFQIQQEPSDKFNYLITPGAGEPEVLSRPSAKYLVEDKLKLPFNQREMRGNVQLVKLRQLYGLDPVGAAVLGGTTLIKENPTGKTLGVAASLLDPDLPKAIKKDDYTKATKIVARDVLGGAAIEGVAKTGLPIAGRYLPQLTPVIQTGGAVLSRVSPALTGAAIFTQGQDGSLSDIVTQKAAENQIPFLPSNNPNPETDIGARSGKAIMNESKYIFNNLLKGRIPYMK